MTQIKRLSLKKDAFPFIVLFWDEGTKEVLRRIEVTGPGVVRIPCFAPRKVGTTVLHFNGDCTSIDSNEEEVDTPLLKY